MIGATRATWGHVFPITPSRAPTSDKGVLVAPRGPNVKKWRFSAISLGPRGTVGGHLPPPIWLDHRLGTTFGGSNGTVWGLIRPK